MLDLIAVMMAGRIAEELISGDISSGAAGDIQQATAVAHSMVCQWGMSDKLGMVQYGNDGDRVFMGRDMVQRQDYSEFTAQEIDTEVKRIINEAYQRAKSLIEAIATNWKSSPTPSWNTRSLDGEQVKQIVATGTFTPPAAAAQGRPAFRRARRHAALATPPSRCRPSCPATAPPLPLPSRPCAHVAAVYDRRILRNTSSAGRAGFRLLEMRTAFSLFSRH